MASRLNPYLHFRSNAQDAMEFYRSVFGGNLEVMPFGDMAESPEEKNMVMHAQLTAPNGFVLMGSDTPARFALNTGGSGMTVSLSGDDDAELRGYWTKLGAGATIQQPLEMAPWGDSFGMLIDRFGTPWLVNIAGPRH